MTDEATMRAQTMALEYGITLDNSRNLNKVVPEVTSAAVRMRDAFSAVATSLQDTLTNLQTLQLPATSGADVPGSKTSKFALGGMSGSDTIPAMLSPGEFVVNAASTRRFYSQLVNMNSVGRFASGGPVGNHVNVGDVNVSMHSSGNETVDVVRIGKLLQREIRRGTVSLS